MLMTLRHGCAGGMSTSSARADEAAEQMSEHPEAPASEAHDRLTEATAAHAAGLEQTRTGAPGPHR
jgi:hypothetical protein